MEATPMIDALQKLREVYQQPRGHMEIIRDALQHQLANAAGVSMPPLLNDGQRQAFAGKLDMLKSFLESEDGADAIELLMDAWHQFEGGYGKAKPEGEDEED